MAGIDSLLRGIRAVGRPRALLFAAALLMVGSSVALSSPLSGKKREVAPRPVLPRDAKAVPNASLRGMLGSMLTVRDVGYPVVSLTASTTTAGENQTVTFDASGSIPGEGSIVDYTWDFGDGYVTDTGASSGTSHSFRFAGPKTVTVYVTNSSGLTASTTLDLTITGSTAIQSLPGCWASALSPNDDGSSAPVDIGFPVNYFGDVESTLYVNNNGNVTFGGSQSDYTPYPLEDTHESIIAPFFADVDTRSYGSGSDLTTYGQTTVTLDGVQHAAFCVIWGGEGGGVGYYGEHTDKLDRFQLLLIDRSDVAPGDFDIEFNYDGMQWEAGDASGGQDGLGGTSAAVGFTNGSEDAGTYFELPGSLINGALIDGGSNSLVAGSNGTGVPGSYLYQVRPLTPLGDDTITGNVTAPGSGGSVSVPYAPVQACPSGGGDCTTTHADSSGHYTLLGLANGAYVVTAFVPSDSDQQQAGVDFAGDNPSAPVTVTLSDATPVTQDLALRGVALPPDGTTVQGIATEGNGEPEINWEVPAPLTVQGCTGGTASYEIAATNSETGQVQTQDGTMTAGSGDGATTTYTATIPTLYPLHGDAVLTTTVTGCPNSADDATASFDVYIDPSGTVTTTSGQPVVGATVTLLNAASPSGPFSEVANGSSVMSTANRTNPMLSSAGGAFGWDTVAGYYEIQAQMAGCHAPGNPGQGYADSSVIDVPPAVTDVSLTLDCGPGISASGGDFGQLSQGGSTVSRDITVDNIGPGPLTVRSVAVSGTGYSIDADGCQTPVAIAGSCTVTVKFNPAAAGVASGSLAITSDGTSSPLTVPLTASVAAPPSPVTPASVSASYRLGKVRTAGSAAKVPLTCTGTAGASCTVKLVFSVRETLKHGKVIAVAAAAPLKAKRKLVRTLTVASATVTVPAGSSATFSVRLNRAGQGLLRARKRFTSALVATPTGVTASASAATHVNVRFTAPKKKKKKK